MKIKCIHKYVHYIIKIVKKESHNPWSINVKD